MTSRLSLRQKSALVRAREQGRASTFEMGAVNAQLGAAIAHNEEFRTEADSDMSEVNRVEEQHYSNHQDPAHFEEQDYWEHRTSGISWESISDNLLASLVIDELSGCSDESRKRSFALSALKSRNGLLFTYDDEVSLRRQLLSSSTILEKRYCGVCQGALASSLDRCRNRSCPRLREPQKRFRDLRRIDVANVDVTSQMRNVLTNNIQEIVETHRLIHSRRYEQLSDSRALSGFQESMESLEEFSHGLMKVQLIINSDGFVYTSLQRGATWPVYCAVWDLDSCVRHKRENAIVVAAVLGASEINDELWTCALSRFNAFLSLSSDSPLLVRSPDGQLFRIALAVTRVDLDSEAIKKLYKLQCWSGPLGCPRCKQPGIYRRRAYRWPFDRTPRLRTPSSAREAAESGTDGFRGPSVWNRMCDSTRISVDALHVLWEGVLDRLLKDTVGSSRSRSPVSISQGDVEELSNCLSTSLFPTYYTAAWDLRDLSKKTGNEKYVTSTSLLPIAVALGMFQNVSAAVLVLAISFITREMDSYFLSRIEREELKKLMETTHELFCSVLGEGAATFKSHLFFAHASEDLLVKGSPMETSTCGFEQLHGQLKTFAGLKNSRGFLRKSLERVIVLSAVLPEVKRRALRGQNLFVDLLHDISPQAASRVMRDSVPMANERFRHCHRDIIQSCDLYAADPSKRELAEAEASLRRSRCKTLLARVLVYGKPLSSSILWRQNMTTQQWYFIVDRETPLAAEALLFDLHRDVLSEGCDLARRAFDVIYSNTVMASGLPPRSARTPTSRPYIIPSRPLMNRTNTPTSHTGAERVFRGSDVDQPFCRQVRHRESLASFLARQSREQTISLVEIGQAYLTQSPVPDPQEIHELLSPNRTRLGHADMSELKSLHENATTADQRAVLEALIGAELLNQHRDQVIHALESSLSNLHGLLRARPMAHSPFGVADPTAEFRYEGMGRFNSIDFNYEYQEFRGTIDVADSDDMKVRAFIRWVLDKLVVDKDDLRKLTARQRDITTDGLIRIPTAFRSAFKNFVLHIAGQQQGSEYSVKIDAILSSVVKESRRNYPGRRTLSQTEQQTMPDGAQFMMDEPLAITDL